MPNLQDDLGAAIVATINGNSSAFASLGNTGGTLHAEYAGQPVNYNSGGSGRCLIRPLEQEVADETEYADACACTFPFAVEFELLDVMDAGNARTAVTQALRTAFSDRGASMFATYFTDNGSNRLGGSGWVKIAVVSEEETSDPDRPRIVARVEVRDVWVKTPAA